MLTSLKMQRLETLPAVVEPSTIYIIKSANAGKVDLYFVGNESTDVRAMLNIDDVESAITAALATFVPARSLTADALSAPFNLTLTGAVSGTASIDGSGNVTLETTGDGSGGGGEGGETPVSDVSQFFVTLNSESGGTASGIPFDTDLLFDNPTDPNNPHLYVLENNYGYTVTGRVLVHSVDRERNPQTVGWDIKALLNNIDGVAGPIAVTITPFYQGDAPISEYVLHMECVNDFVPNETEAGYGMIAHPCGFRLYVQFGSQPIWGTARLTGLLEILKVETPYNS